MEDLRKFPNLTVDQKDLLNRFYDQFNYASPGVNRHIANVELLQYEGAIGGGIEFTIYAITKLYLCFSFLASFHNIANNLVGWVRFYNENNVVNLINANNSITYEAIAAQIFYNNNNANIKNFWFSRYNMSGYTYIKFIGYRITLD